jgi:two-component system OmpR family response regulator
MDSTILVVEDDPHLREVITEVLSDEGYNVYEAMDGQRALERIESLVPDLILSDIRMPRLSGIELAERLKQRRHPIPIVLMSTSNNAPAGDGPPFLAKPFALDDLVALVARILRNNGALGGGRTPGNLAYLP